MVQIYCLHKFYSFYQETRNFPLNSSDNPKSSHKEDQRSDRRYYSQFSRALNSQRPSVSAGKKSFVTRNFSLSKISEENFDYCSTLDFNRDMDSHQMRMYSSEPKLGQKDSTEFIVGPCKIEDVNGNQKKIELIENNKSIGYEKALLMKLFKQNEKIVCV